MFKDGDPKGANAIPARATPSPKWQEAIKESGRRDDVLRKNAHPNKHASWVAEHCSLGDASRLSGSDIIQGAQRIRLCVTAELLRAQNSQQRSTGRLQADHGVAQSGNDLLPRRP